MPNVRLHYVLWAILMPFKHFTKALMSGVTFHKYTTYDHKDFGRRFAEALKQMCDIYPGSWQVFHKETSWMLCFTLKPRALFFNCFHSRQNLSHLCCAFRRHLSELMAYFGVLTPSTSSSKTATLSDFTSCNPSTHLYNLFSILAVSHYLNFFLLTGGSVKRITQNIKELQSEVMQYYIQEQCVTTYFIHKCLILSAYDAC